MNFAKYHAKNPHVYALFVAFAMEAIRAGRRKLSANVIFERIRWESLIRTEGDGFKVNNNYRADCARKFMEEHPEHSGIFRIRIRRSA